MAGSSNVTVVDHPLVQHKLSVMRRRETTTVKFRQLSREVATLLAYEVTRDLPLTTTPIETPIAEMIAPTLAGKKLCFVSILRAGDGLLQGMLDLVPSARVGHIGIYREPETLTAIEYYYKVPEDLQERLVIVVDPMLATGNSAVAAVTRLKEDGAQQIKFVCLLAAPEGIAQFREVHPDVPVFLAASSWAAKLAIVYVTQPRGHPTGLMLLGPGLFPTVDLSLAGRLAVVGGHAVVLTAHLAIPLTPEHYTANPHYLDVIRKDRLRLLSVTLRFYWETARLDRLRSKASAAIALPLLVLQGEGDRMMDVPRTLAWVGGLPTDDATYVSYPGAGHTLDFEPDRSAYLDDMLGWMSARGMRA